MRILFDTNIIIDAAVPRRAYHAVALELIAHVDRGAASGLVVTRNEQDFAGGPLRPYHPEQLAAMLRT